MGGYEVTLAAMDGAAAQMGQVEGVVQAFSDAITSGLGTAAGGVGEGPLADALAALGDGTRDRAGELGAEAAQLAKALRDSAQAYREADVVAGAALPPPSFGGVTG